MKRKFLTFIAFCLVVFFHAPPAGAFFWDDWFKNAQKFVSQVFSPQSKKFTLDSSITLVPEGDYDKNNEIDSGDIITFHYTIANSTDDEYAFATLLTNIPRNNLNFIHNVYGTASLLDEENTITIPNLRIPPRGEVIISFNARINYSPDELFLSTEPELITEDKKSLVKSTKKELKAKPWKKNFPGMIKIEKKN